MSIPTATSLIEKYGLVEGSQFLDTPGCCPGCIWEDCSLVEPFDHNHCSIPDDDIKAAVHMGLVTIISDGPEWVFQLTPVW